MTNIKFGNYTAPKRINKRIDLELGIFFDGTLNNKQNTKERENNTEIYRKHGIKTWVGRQINEKMIPAMIMHGAMSLECLSLVLVKLIRFI